MNLKAEDLRDLWFIKIEKCPGNADLAISAEQGVTDSEGFTSRITHWFKAGDLQQGLEELRKRMKTASAITTLPGGE